MGKKFIVENLKTGERYEIVNLSKWCKDTGVDRSSAYECISGKGKTVQQKHVHRLLRGYSTTKKCKKGKDAHQ